MSIPFHELRDQLEGDLYVEKEYRLLYATDASVYREIPAAVCLPAHAGDVRNVLLFCRLHKLPVIPRTAGTSLAGQVVGHGIVLDFSRHMNKILELNVAARRVRVQPGVILDELLRFLAPHGLFFGPETSSGNRCMIGGMVANNACGAHSLVYGSMRDHTLEIRAVLADGSEAVFGPLTKETFRKKCIGNALENKIHDHLFRMLADKENQEEIRSGYPDPRIKRRNTGYALDLLLSTTPFGGKDDLNLSRLLCGAEGTLAIYTEITLQLVELPPPVAGLLCVHTRSVTEAIQANLVALQHGPVAVELMDHHILQRTRDNLLQRKNRFFVKGEPGAILLVEFAAETLNEIIEKARSTEAGMKAQGIGYHFPLLFDSDMDRVWSLRKAGLGLLSNVPGDAKPVSVIEDTAVHPEMLPAFIRDVQALIDRLGLQCVYHAHIGSGELHLRPLLNLKSRADVERFAEVAREMAQLVKKHRGSLSGEHGDGRLRGPFLRDVLGDKCYDMLVEVKRTWDPENILNPGKIVDTPSVKESLRHQPGAPVAEITTWFDFSKTLGFLRAIEQCNGSGDCRKLHPSPGVMCPSYQATRNEYDSTRGRANLLREIITNSSRKDPLTHNELRDILDLCLSCKGCKAECPSNVDMGKYKGEILQHAYNAFGTPVRTRITGAYASLYRAGSFAPFLFNLLATGRVTSGLVKSALGFAGERSLPLLYGKTLRRWGAHYLKKSNPDNPDGKKVYVFADEFTDLNDTLTGIRTCLLLERLGYRPVIPAHTESGRGCLSKGLLKKATRIAKKNIAALAPLVNEQTPLVGIEPSAILGFRDEYPDLVRDDTRRQALHLASNAFTIDEFIAREYEAGWIDPDLFDGSRRTIYLHTHCHQKALSAPDHAEKMLQIPPNNKVHHLECGCCGMAGAFGYEKNHYQISMQIGELALFPAIRRTPADAIIAASGTSCRQQIRDGTGREALHPAEVLYGCLKKEQG